MRSLLTPVKLGMTWRRLLSCSPSVLGAGSKSSAVIFDLGGVVLPSPFAAAVAWEKANGFKRGDIFSVLQTKRDGNAWMELEKGRLSLEEFYQPFAEECSSHLGKPVTAKHIESFMDSLTNAMRHPNQDVLKTVSRLRAHGLKTAILTNNWRMDSGDSLNIKELDLFDVVVESCKVDLRKPDQEIYNYVLEKLGVEAESAVFLDDIASNLKGAKALGIQTIKVEDVSTALAELQDILSLDLGITAGTTEVRKGMELDKGALTAYLRSVLDINPENEIEIRQFSHGQSNPTYLVQHGSDKWVLRKKPPGKLLPGAHSIEREFRVMKALGECSVPVPKMVHICTDGTVIGTPFYLMDYCDGTLLKDPKLPGLTRDDRVAVYSNLVETLAKLHAVDPVKAGLGDYGKHDNFVHRQIKTWSRQYQASQTEPIPDMDKVMAWLPKNVPLQIRTSVIHGDFRVDNVIFQKKDYSQVQAILDWELSTLGDPLTDIAYMCIPHYIPSDNPMLRGLEGLELESLGIPSDTDIMQKYCDLSGLSDIPHWNFYLSFGFFRLAAILQGVYKRALHGQASGSNPKIAGEIAKQFASTSLKLSQKQSSQIIGVRRFHTSSARNRDYTNIEIPAISDRAKTIHSEVKQFVREEILPVDQLLRDHQEAEIWEPHPQIEILKAKAKSAGLWNLFITAKEDPEQRFGVGLTNLEYAHICEQMGLSVFAPEIFNCNAPDTGNMEVLLKYGNKEQQGEWLIPLTEGKIRSCFAMTEPKVASSDATNIQSSIERSGDEYVINGHKWWTSNAMDPRTEICIFMGKTDPGAARHRQQSMILVPFKTPGVKIVRPLSVFGTKDAPGGHAEVIFDNVRVPASNMLLGEGRGFEIAQGRLGPGRIHHCMRFIGHCERALELMIERVKTRVAFGKPLIEQGTIQRDIAMSRVEIDQARLLTLRAAHMMDTVGNKAAAPEIAMIKVVAPSMTQRVVDRAMQSFGGAGLNSDLPLASFYAAARSLRFADGPDEVHLRSLFRFELK